MGTRAVYTFCDERGQHSVFSHWDNYPSCASVMLKSMLLSDKVWELPRFEAGEFAAGFVAQHKEGRGDIRLTNAPMLHEDIEYWYRIFQAKNGQLLVRAYEVDNWDLKWDVKEIYYGRIKDWSPEE